MKTIITMIWAGMACTFCAHAQQYKAYLNKANIRTISFQLNNSSLQVIGTDSDSLTITELGAGPANLKDSSGIDLHFTTSWQTLLVEKMSERPKSYLIKLPRRLALTIDEAFRPPQKLEIRNMAASVIVHSWVSKITLINNKGAVTAKSEAGDIFATLPPGLNQPYSLISSGRAIDITIPKKSKITLNAEMVAGRLITDFKLDSHVKTAVSDSLQTIKGPFNGGGAMLKVKSNTLILHQ